MWVAPSPRDGAACAGEAKGRPASTIVRARLAMAAATGSPPASSMYSLRRGEGCGERGGIGSGPTPSPARAQGRLPQSTSYCW